MPWMTPFHTTHNEVLEGSLSSFDRVVFKGHLKPLMYGQGVEKFLSSKGMLIRDFKKLVERLSGEVDRAARAMAEAAGRPYEYLNSYHIRKERKAAEIAERDGITQGLVAVFAAVEGAQSFRVASGKGRPQMQVPVLLLPGSGLWHDACSAAELVALSSANLPQWARMAAAASGGRGDRLRNGGEQFRPHLGLGTRPADRR